MVHYAININGKIYEGSEDKATAIILYNSVDGTCLHYLDGQEKSLIREDGEERTELKKGIIKVPKRLRHRIEVYNCILEEWGEIDTKLAEALTTLALTQEERSYEIALNVTRKLYEADAIEKTIEEQDKEAISVLRKAIKNGLIVL